MIAAILVFKQQRALTCAGGYAFTGSIDGFLAPCSCLLKHAVPTARAVSVAVEKTNIFKLVTKIFRHFKFNKLINVLWINSFNMGWTYLCIFETESTVKLWYCVIWSSYLHCAPNLNLQSEVQHGSSLRWSSPGSHSSPFSTLEFPHTLLFLSLKHTGALKRNVFPMEILLQLEKRFGVGGREVDRV